MKQILTIILFLPLSLIAKDKITVDLIIKNAKIFSADINWSNYEAIAIKGGVIVALGKDKTILEEYTSTNIIDANEKTIFPGFIDAHCHFSGYALDKYKCNLFECKSEGELIERVSAYEKTNKLTWIYGRGWDQNLWTVKEFPTKEKLDQLFPNKPVILKRVDGHAILCNQKALDLAKINEHTQISGGQIIKKDGKLTGILIDNAMDVVEKIIPTLPKTTQIKYLQETEKEFYENGVTAFMDCGVKKDMIELEKELYNKKMLSIGNVILLNEDTNTIRKYLLDGPQNYGQLKITGIKMYADGALGSRGACLLQPYTDDPKNYGTMLTTKEHMKYIAGLAYRHGWQLCTHAIGDSANRVVLQVYAEVLQGTNERRWRIEHAQVVNPSDLHYFKEYSIIPSVQPTHYISDRSWAVERLGKNRFDSSAYIYDQLYKQNNIIAFGTDFPVEKLDPLATIAAAKLIDPTDTTAVKNKPKYVFDVPPMIRATTIWAAKSMMMGQDKGSLEIGKDADLVILDKNILTIPRKEITTTKVLYTIVKGKIKYKVK